MIDIANIFFKDKPLEYINIGGGFFGEIPEELQKQFKVYIPTFEEYSKAVGQVFANTYGDNGPLLIIEPGISIVGNTMDFFAEVIEVKEMHDKKIAICDTSINVLNPTKSSIDKTFTVVNDVNANLEHTDEYKIVGNTCMEHDILKESYVGKIERGSFLKYTNRGAYSNNYTPAFIMPPPAIVDHEGVIIKNRDDVVSVLFPYESKQETPS